MTSIDILLKSGKTISRDDLIGETRPLLKPQTELEAKFMLVRRLFRAKIIKANHYLRRNPEKMTAKQYSYFTDILAFKEKQIEGLEK